MVLRNAIVRIVYLSTIAVILCLQPATVFALASDWRDATRSKALSAIQAFMSSSAAHAARPIPALSVSIGRDGELLFAGGFGEAAGGRLASAETVYKIGSVSKQFTAATVLRLIELGATSVGGSDRISLETPVSKILSGTDSWVIEGGEPISLRNLLTMTSNLPNFTRRPPKNLDPWGAVPARELLSGIKRMQPAGLPGSFEYSNTSYFLLSEAIGAMTAGVAPASYQDTVRIQILERLGLKNTGFVTNSTLARRLAAPHYRRKPVFAMPDWLQGSADLQSTVLDLFRWNTALMQDRLLGRPTRDLMFADLARVEVWTYYGMGWFIRHDDGRDLYFHSGSVPGYTAFNAIELDAKGHWTSISVLTNSDGVEGLDDLASELLDISRVQ